MFICTSSISLLGLTILTIFMVVRNTSFNEARSFNDIACRKGVFDVGKMENIKMIMGDNPWKWLVPEVNPKRRCNGIDFKLRDT